METATRLLRRIGSVFLLGGGLLAVREGGVLPPQLAAGIDWIHLGTFLAIAGGLVFALQKVAGARKEVRISRQELLQVREEAARDMARLTSELQVARSHLEDREVQLRWAEVKLSGIVAETVRLREREEELLRCVPDGLLVTDLENRLLVSNPAAQRLLQLTGRPGLLPLRMMIGDPELQKQLESLLAHAGDGSREIEWLCRQRGTRMSLRARVTSCVDRQGRAVGRIILMQDLTREREIERLKSGFLAMTAHELKTPLTAILGFAEVLQRRDIDLTCQEREECLELLQERAQTLSAVVGDLLDLVQVESGYPLPLWQSRFELSEALEPVLERHRGPDDRLNVEVPRNFVVFGDRERISQVLDILIDNAVKYSPRDRRIDIRAVKRGRSLAISVRDQGRGMSREQAGKAFDKFFRADCSNTASSGMGIGLTLARCIVEAHGGSIRVKSGSGKGTLVRLCLPLIEAGDESHGGAGE